MKKKTIGLILILLATVYCTGCGKTYTCDTCGEETKEAYYDPYEEDEYMCKKCAQSYFAPFPYSQYKVED